MRAGMSSVWKHYAWIHKGAYLRIERRKDQQTKHQSRRVGSIGLDGCGVIPAICFSDFINFTYGKYLSPNLSREFGDWVLRGEARWGWRG